MFHIALAIHGRVPRSETVRRIRYVFFLLEIVVIAAIDSQLQIQN